MLAFLCIHFGLASLSPGPPSWPELRARALVTDTGARLAGDLVRGPPSAAAHLRLFDAQDASDLRVTFYRDAAAWCPYCQKTWLLLEEKQIPYRVEKVPLNAYGYKPASYTRRVDGGKLPAIELDGEIHTESLEIMRLLDATFEAQAPRMVPAPDHEDARRAEELFELEARMVQDWFSLVFYPVDGPAVLAATAQLNATLCLVNEALGATPGPWFLGGEAPSMVDLQYIVSVERLLASVLYFKGIQLRTAEGGLVVAGTPCVHLERWLAAFEARPSYVATKSDFYTHAFSLPSQNGPGYFVPEAAAVSARICGLDDSWSLSHLHQQWLGSGSADEPLAPLQRAGGPEAARHEAAYYLASNSEAVIQFAARGAGERGRPAFPAELADPNAVPNEDVVDLVDLCLRHVMVALLEGTDDDTVLAAARTDLAGRVDPNGELMPGWEEYSTDEGRLYYWHDETGEEMWTSKPTGEVDACLAYLRDRVGVPRDMGAGAALYMRATLNWAIALLYSEPESRRAAD